MIVRTCARSMYMLAASIPVLAGSWVDPLQRVCVRVDVRVRALFSARASCDYSFIRLIAHHCTHFSVDPRRQGARHPFMFVSVVSVRVDECLSWTRAGLDPVASPSFSRPCLLRCVGTSRVCTYTNTQVHVSMTTTSRCKINGRLRRTSCLRILS